MVLRGRLPFLGNEIAKSDLPDLTATKVIAFGGRTLSSSERSSKIERPLADNLAAALINNSAAVDAGYAPNDGQVGQTSKVVAPRLYIAGGISGATMHLAGMSDSRMIVGINKTS